MANGLQTLTTRLPNGVTNAASWQTMGNAGQLDPSWSYTVFDDFVEYFVGVWTLTGVNGTATGSVMPAQFPGGYLKLATVATAADSICMQKAALPFNLTYPQGKASYFKIAFLGVSNAGTMQTGLTGANPLGATDGVFFRRLSGLNQFSLVVLIAGAETVYTLPTVMRYLNSTTVIELGFEITTSNLINVFFNPTTGQSAPTASSNRGPVFSVQVDTLPTAQLGPSCSIVNTTATLSELSIDYIFASRDR
jgi:hypothetical protein